MSDKTQIEEGDEVQVIWGDGEKTTGTVIHKSVATGDMWIIKWENQLFYINPNSSNLDMIRSL